MATIECNSIIAEAQALQLRFQKCKTLSATDMRKVMDIIIALKGCSGSGGGVGTLTEIVAGANITVDDTDPAKPVISAVLNENKTVSLLPPSGIPSNGDEWITYTNP
jgi:hypothetical protein